MKANVGVNGVGDLGEVSEWRKRDERLFQKCVLTTNSIPDIYPRPLPSSPHKRPPIPEFLP